MTPYPPDTIFIDVAGSSHLFKGEAALLKDMQRRLAEAQLPARVAIADTPGCAWAVSHYGQDEIVPPGRSADVLGGLPIAALRLPAREITGLREVGIERVAELAKLPRASLRQRFSGDVLLRLDQALGAAVEVLTPVVPPEVPRMTLKFPEPIGTPEDLQRVMALLCEKLMIDLAALGARRLDMVFQRVDNIAQAIRIGTSKSNRDTKHLTKLLAERLVLIEPGFGIEEATLTASWVEALTERQTVGMHVAEAGSEVVVSQLVDTLRVRLGISAFTGLRLSKAISLSVRRSGSRRLRATAARPGHGICPGLPGCCRRPNLFRRRRRYRIARRFFLCGARSGIGSRARTDPSASSANGGFRIRNSACLLPTPLAVRKNWSGPHG